MPLIGQLNSGHKFDEVAADEVSGELLNKQFEDGSAEITTPIALADGGTGGATAIAAQKALAVSGYVQGWVEFSDTTVTLGTVPVDSYNHQFHLQVTEAFDDSGADQIRLGTSGDDDEFFTLTDVSTTGIKSPTAGANAGYNAAAKTVIAEYVGANTDATVGKALVILEYMQVDTQP